MSEAPDADAALRETTIARRTVHAGRFIRFRVDTVRGPDGRQHQREIVDHPGAVAIVPLDGTDLLLVRQFRSAAQRVLLEIPAGTLDRRTDGTIEPPEEAAPRELAEETGYEAGTWRRVGHFWTAPGFASEAMTLYLATDLRPVRDYGGPEEDEHLQLIRLPWQTALAQGGGRRDRGREDAHRHPLGGSPGRGPRRLRLSRRARLPGRPAAAAVRASRPGSAPAWRWAARRSP